MAVTPTPHAPVQRTAVNYRDTSPALGGQLVGPPSFRQRQSGPGPASVPVAGNPYREDEVNVGPADLEDERETGLSWGASYVDAAILEQAAADVVQDQTETD